MLKALNIGTLDQRIAIQSVVESTGADGFPSGNWSNAYASIPAKREYGTSSEKEDNGQQINEQGLDFLIRYHSSITTDNRVVYGGKIYEIIATEEMGRRQGLLLKCKFFGNDE